MLSSNSSSCNQNPNYIPFFENEITSFTSNLVEDPNFLSAFPNSPYLLFEYDDVYLPPLFAHADLDTNNTATAAAGKPTAPATSKKDRHSKIDTARGLRDRRMRLSLDIARRFFDLQDMLGYDKASRTVDWLLRNASSAIGELERRSRGVCNNSESCTSKLSTTTTTSTKRVKKRGVQQKRATVARESRRKARERARERTSQKRRLMRENATAAAADVNHLSSDFSQATTNELAFQWNAAFLEVCGIEEIRDLFEEIRSLNLRSRNNLISPLGHSIGMSRILQSLSVMEIHGKPTTSFNVSGSASSFYS